MSIIYQNSKAQKATNAIVTMLMGNNINYIIGSYVLAKSIKFHNSIYPIVILVNQESNDYFAQNKTLNNILYSMFDMVILVPSLQNRTHANLWEKLFAFSLVMFDKLLWLGSDTVLAHNIDRMLLCPPPCGVYDEHIWSLDAIGAVVNGDVFVFKPNLQDFVNLMFISMPDNLGMYTDLDEDRYYYSSLPPYTYFGPVDQGLLNQYFHRYITVLPKLYQLELGGPLATAEANLYIPGVTRLIHFAAWSKPWIAESVSRNEVWCPIAHLIRIEFGVDIIKYCPYPLSEIDSGAAQGSDSGVEVNSEVE
jgi:hypothetical protein